MASVLHVVSYFPPDRVGGVGEVVATVHRELLEAGHRSHVVTSGTSRGDPRVSRVARGSIDFPLMSVRALALAREADVVHLHHGEGLGLLAAIRLARVDVPVLLTLHVGVGAMAASLAPYRVAGHAFGRESGAAVMRRLLAMPVRALLDRAALAMADDVSFIAASAARDNLDDHAAARARIIYNGVHLPAASVESASPVDLLFVGADTPRKRVESLPLLLYAVRRRHPTARLRIVGLSPESNPEILRLAERLRVSDGIEFAGVLRTGDLGAQYRAAKVLLVPSAYEGLPMVILEAFSHGLTCVATAVSGHPEVVADGRNGYLVPLDDIEAMAERASSLLSDSGLRQSLGAAARATVAARFTARRQVDEYLDWYAGHVEARCGR
ncbi:MAG TPA: glycosyltransferase family 4 protein [Gemmatimonadaceae bacterium]|nr:glycosyltransferase family 4 protein [Gemmatimonadaceae bacterium]